ncbi:MAG: hypothetical protein KDD69_12105 [Bdellovibrionales bacterium]|nr:hypothetical protein [Bdellovibrionales bacterium]
MSKERELLNQLKESIVHSDAGGQAANAAGGAAQSGAAQQTADVDFASVFDSLNSLGASMVGDPIFYLKAVAVLVLTVMIIMVAFQLIAGN